LSASGSVGSGPVGHGAGQGATVPGVEAAQASALTEFGLLAGGDYGGAWDLWTERAQRAVSRSDFVRFQDTCPTALGVPVRVVSAQPADSAGVDRTRDVVLTWQRGSVTGTARMMYADGSWRYEPDQATLNGYSRGCPPSA
jgi:hypothetical protein